MPRLPSLSLVGETAIDYGQHYELVLEVADLDLTGATVVAKLRNLAGQIVIQFDAELVVLSPLLTDLKLTLSRSLQQSTPLFQPGVYDWDVLLVPAVTVPRYLFGGKVVVNRRISDVTA